MNDKEYRDLDRRLYTIEKKNNRYPETGYPVVSTFPTGISSGFICYRSDLTWLCYYDGTRWLTTHEYPVSVIQVSAGAGTYVIGVIRQDYAPYVTRVIRHINVGVTNNGSNYWTVTVLGVNATQSASTNVDIATTAAQTASTWATSDGAPSVTAVPANKAVFDFSLTATGAPSVIPAIVMSVHYRLIVT